MDANAGKRRDALTERNQNLEGTTEYNSKNYEVRGYSENIGEGAIDAHIKAKGYNTVHEGTGAYNLDRVYEKDGIFYVVEDKVGNSGLGGKNVTVNGERKFAQQGTQEYLEKTVEDLRIKIEDYHCNLNVL